MKRVYNSNMAAVDDAIGVMRQTLTEQQEKFGNKTLIVFSQVSASLRPSRACLTFAGLLCLLTCCGMNTLQDNGGPANMANNFPLCATSLCACRHTPQYCELTMHLCVPV